MKYHVSCCAPASDVPSATTEISQQTPRLVASVLKYLIQWHSLLFHAVWLKNACCSRGLTLWISAVSCPSVCRWDTEDTQRLAGYKWCSRPERADGLVLKQKRDGVGLIGFRELLQNFAKIAVIFTVRHVTESKQRGFSWQLSSVLIIQTICA